MAGADVGGDGGFGDPARTRPDGGREHPAEEELRHARFLQRIGARLARVGGWTLELPDMVFEASEELDEILLRYGGTHSLVEALAQVREPYRSRIGAAFEACTTSGTTFDLEVPRAGPDGEERWLRVVAEAHRAPDGAIARIIGAVQDVTEQRLATERLQELAQRLEEMVESITDGFFAFDREWRITYVNRRGEEMMDRPIESVLGRVVWDVFPVGGTVVGDAYLRSMAERTTEIVEEFYVEPSDMWLTIHIYPSPTGISVLYQDVSAQRRSLEELREREHRLAEQAALLDEARDAIVVRDLDHRITFWNRSAELLFGWTAAEAVGRDLRELVFRDEDVVGEAWRRLLEVGHWHGELPVRTIDGQDLVADCRKTLMRDEHGRPHRVLSMMTDVTERRLFEAQLLRAQRIEGIGALASGLAHNLNNALTPITMLSELLGADEVDPRRRGMFDTIRSSAQRATDMVRQILSYAGAVEVRQVPLSVESLLVEVARIAEDTFLKAVRIEREAVPSVASVSGDPTQLHQVLLNLCVNARDAMVAGGVLHLSADEVEVDPRTARLRGVAPGRYVRLSVRDDGHGIDPEIIDHIFEPFFTTKEPGRGTGLGLSTSAGIIGNHGGFITVESWPGTGTTFFVHLPAVAAAERPQPDDPPVLEARPGRGQRVLVVDDDELLRSVVVSVLQDAGYRTVEAGDGAAAVHLLGAEHEVVELIITDMMMPGMSGTATIEALRRARPGVPIVATSGLQTNAEAATALGVTRFLPKPFSIDVLLATLRDVLADR